MNTLPLRDYARVISYPQVLPTFAASVAGRSAYALVFLPLFFIAEGVTVSVGFAGVTVATYGAAASFLAPLRAWFIDRYGPRRVLNILVPVFAVLLGAVGWVGLSGPSQATLLVLIGCAGAVAPPLGPTMRVAWAALLPESQERTLGLSADAVVEELVFLAGPALAGLALVWLSPGQAMFIPAVLVAGGGLLFANSRAIKNTEPAPPAPRESAPTARLFTLNFAGLLVPSFVAGAVSGMVGVAVPSHIEALGGAATVGLALGLFAAGSAVGGLIFGVLKLRMEPAPQMFCLGALLLVTVSGVALATNSATLYVVLVAAGLFFSPVMILSYVLAPERAAAQQQNLATTLVNTSHNLGSAAFGAVTGIAIEGLGIRDGVLGVIGVAAIALLVGLLLTRSMNNNPTQLKG